MRGLLITLLLFGVVNGILYAGQEVWRAGDKRAFEALKREMDGREHELQIMKVEIGSLRDRIEMAKSRITELQAEARQTEARYAQSGAPSDAYRRYKAVIAEHNRLANEVNPLAKRYNALIDTHNSKVDAYNRDVPRFNELADRAFSRWYIIPIPGRSSKAPGRVPARTLVPAPAR